MSTQDEGIRREYQELVDKLQRTELVDPFNNPRMRLLLVLVNLVYSNLNTSMNILVVRRIKESLYPDSSSRDLTTEVGHTILLHEILDEIDFVRKVELLRKLKCVEDDHTLKELIEFLKKVNIIRNYIAHSSAYRKELEKLKLIENQISILKTLSKAKEKMENVIEKQNQQIEIKAAQKIAKIQK